MENRKSILGINWQQKDFDERLAMTLQQRFDLPDVLAKIVAAKNIELDDVENFLNPTIKATLPNPFDLLDMDVAVEHVIDAVAKRKKITIFADYDVDGATSAALMRRFFRALKINVDIYVPDRVLEGYGPNSAALLNLKKNGTDLVITVDCGTVSFAPLEDAKKAGLEIIVIDHHLGVIEKPAALAVINPNRIDENFSHKNLCAAGVCFLFAVAINKSLREQSLPHLSSPDLMNLLDLVALGTVCDVMPLTGLSRAFVTHGLKVLKARQNLGIRALCDVAGLDEEASAYHLGFILGPRINAGGRVGKSDLGARILSTEDENEAREIAKQLNDLNAQRKEIEKQVLEDSIKQLEKKENGFGVDDQIIFAVGKGWHQGVIGIVASRLKDLYNKPTAVIAVDALKGKASCRSINGVDFGNAILQARLKGLLLEGGGHAMAGGFSIAEDKIQDLHKFFHELLGEKIAELTKEKTREFSAMVDLENVNIELLYQLLKLEPYGSGNSRPKFMIRNLRKMNAKIIGETKQHISCNFSSLSSVGFAGNLQAIAFRSADTPMAQILLDDKFAKPISVVGELNINRYMGTQKVQMVIEDVLV